MKKYMSVALVFFVCTTRCCNETVSYSNLSINLMNKKGIIWLKGKITA